MPELTPLQNIKKYCQDDCMNGSYKELELCPSVNCPLFYLRFGRREKKINVLKAIKENCKMCYEFFRKCDDKKCPLNVYRLGHNPKLKGKRGKGNVSYFKKKG